MGDRPVALVTGASRGIGKSCSVHLARAGFDVAVSARTVQEGEEREHSSTVRRSDTSPLPGSLSATAALVAEAGGDALIVAADLLDYDSKATGTMWTSATCDRMASHRETHRHGIVYAMPVVLSCFCEDDGHPSRPPPR